MQEYSSLFVCLMGMGTVFFGLICLIVLTMIMGKLCGKEPAAIPTATPTPAAGAAPAPEANRQEIAAAISAVLAEEMGTDITGIRILSLRKL